METADVAALTTAHIVALSTAQVAALKPTQIAALTTTQVAALETADIGALTSAQLVALTTAQVAALTTAQIVALKPTQISALETADVAALTTAQIVAIETTDMAALTTAQVAALTTTQVQALTTAHLSHLSMTQVDSFTTAQLQAMTATQIDALALSTPLVLDLNGDGVQTTHLTSGVKFDLNADGVKETTGWTAGGDGLLTIDLNGDGKVNDGSELFGSSFKLADGSLAKDGFEALKSLDSNHDGVVNSSDALFASLQVWVDANNDGVSDKGEMFHLKDLGITQFNLGASTITELNHGNLLGLESTYETSDGQTHTVADVWFRTDANGNQNIDLTQLNPQTVGAHTLGAIDLAADAGKATTLTVDAKTVSELGKAGQVEVAGNGAAAPVQMIIHGDSNDTVNINNASGEWHAGGTATVDGASYNVFNDGNVQLLVATDVHTWVH